MIKYTPEQLDSIIEQIKEIISDAQNKLRALDLRLFIDQLYPREEEISKKDLADVNRRIVGLNERIRKVEECLGIDFKLDKVEPVQDYVDFIDYSFIQDRLLREKANAYYREMLRYKYATRNHKQCFGEFCRLAIIQVELMLNYFFADEHKFCLVVDKIAEIAYNKAMKSYRENGGIIPQKQDYIEIVSVNKISSVLELGYTYKIQVFSDKYYLSKKYIRHNKSTSISLWTSDMRNRKSHGSQTTFDPYEGDYLTADEKTKLEEWWEELKNDIDKYNKIHKKQITFEGKQLIAKTDIWNDLDFKETKALYNKFAPLQWVSEKPFDDVHQFLRIIASTCARELGKKD